MTASILEQDTGLPPGSEVYHLPKRTGLLGMLDTAMSFVIWHYAFWGLWGSCFFCLALYFNLVSYLTAFVFLAVYWLQIALWRPQYSSGLPWYKLVLYNPWLDCFFHYLGATVIREVHIPDTL